MICNRLVDRRNAKKAREMGSTCALFAKNADF
jgi:hypothetical protein